MYDSSEDVTISELESDEEKRYLDETKRLQAVKTMLNSLEMRGFKVGACRSFARRLVNTKLEEQGVRVDLVYQLWRGAADSFLNIQVLFTDTGQELIAFLRGGAIETRDDQGNPVRLIPVQSIFTSDGDRLVENDWGGYGFLDVRPYDEAVRGQLL